MIQDIICLLFENYPLFATSQVSTFLSSCRSVVGGSSVFELYVYIYVYINCDYQEILSYFPHLIQLSSPGDVPQGVSIFTGIWEVVNELVS